MTKPNQLQDLIINGGVSQRDVDRLARRLFTVEDSTPIIEGYTTTMPNFDDLPDTCKQFIRKAIAFSTVKNILDVEIQPEDTGGFYGSDDDLYTQAGIDAHGTADRDETAEIAKRMTRDSFQGD